MKSIALFILFFTISSGFSYEMSDYPSITRYDGEMSNLTDVYSITNLLYNSDPDILISVLKRVGQLKIKEAKTRVESLIGESNPGANMGKAVQGAKARNLYFISILVLGKIGDEQDGRILADCLADTTDPIAISLILSSMGELTESKTALYTLNEYTRQITCATDGRVVKSLVNALINQNSRSSFVPLIRLSSHIPQSMQDLVNYAVMKINKNGIRETVSNEIVFKEK